MYASRKVYIDGEVPFEEANYAKFNYSTGLAGRTAARQRRRYVPVLPGARRSTPCSLEVTLGEMGDTQSVRLQQIVDSVNEDYLEILKLTGRVSGLNTVTTASDRVLPECC